MRAAIQEPGAFAFYYPNLDVSMEARQRPLPRRLPTGPR